MRTFPSPDEREACAGAVRGGVYILRVRCLGRPQALRSRTQLVRGFSDVPKGAVVLLVEQKPWPIGGHGRIRYAMRVAGAHMVAHRTGAPLLELEAASVWPLARPFHLHDALNDVSAYDGRCPIRRLSNLHEQEIRRGDWLGPVGCPIDNQELDEPVRQLFHTLWSKGHDGPGYDKHEWTDLLSMLKERGIRI